MMLSSFIYPKSCLSCKYPLYSKGETLFCLACQSLFDPIDASKRCKQCFSEDCEIGGRSCQRCKRNHPSMSQVAALFDYRGPAAALIKQLKYHKSFQLAEGIGAYMAAYLIQNQWPIPDLIIPIPISSLRKWQRGFNHSQIIAEAMGKILDVPVKMLLKRQNRSTSQAALNKEERIKMNKGTYQLKRSPHLADQSLLLIDDVMTTGTTLRHCADVLDQACPQSIQALTFCLN